MIARNTVIFMITEENLMKRLYSGASRYVVTHKTKISQSSNIMKDLPVPARSHCPPLCFSSVFTFFIYSNILQLHLFGIYVCLSKRREKRRGHTTEASNVYVLSGWTREISCTLQAPYNNIISSVRMVLMSVRFDSEAF